MSMRVKVILYGLICIYCAFGAAWAGYHLFFMALGKGPLLIDEPNTWLARLEFLFAVSIIALGLSGLVYAGRKLKSGRCPLCGSTAGIGKDIPTKSGRAAAPSTHETADIGRQTFTVPTDRKGAADA